MIAPLFSGRRIFPISSTLPAHTTETVPAESRPSLEAAQAAFGSVPNLIGEMASSPALADIFEKKTSLDVPLNARAWSPKEAA